MSDYERDPRPDLASDHSLWVALLTIAKRQPGQDEPDSIFGMLHCMRCCGASLERDRDYGLIIRAGEWERAGPGGYDAFRAKHLAPRRDSVVALLKSAAAGIEARAGPREAATASPAITARETAAASADAAPPPGWYFRERGDFAPATEGQLHLFSLGWTQEDFDDMDAALARDPAVQGRVTIGKATAEHVDLIICRDDSGAPSSTLERRYSRVATTRSLPQI